MIFPEIYFFRFHNSLFLIVSLIFIIGLQGRIVSCTLFLTVYFYQEFEQMYIWNRAKAKQINETAAYISRPGAFTGEYRTTWPGLMTRPGMNN